MSLRIAMIAHGVPNHQTAWLAERLNIQSIADLGNLSVIHVVRVPHHLRAALIRLRLAHGAAENGWEAFAAPDFDLDDDHDWNTYDATELQRLANVALAHGTLINHLQTTMHGLADSITNFVADADAILSDSSSQSSQASSATASTEQFEDSSDAGGAEAEDAQIAFE
jgi:hypothetical protein